jgi:hypothetical protein
MPMVHLVDLFDQVRRHLNSRCWLCVSNDSRLLTIVAHTPISNQRDTFAPQIDAVIPVFGVDDWAFEINDAFDIDLPVAAIV